MSQVNDPKAPQNEVVNLSTTNNQARVGAYTDTAITDRNVDGVLAASNLPPASGSTTTGSVRPVYAADKQNEIENTDAASENADVDQPPHSPNSWQMQTREGSRRSRDPYANNGTDSYLRNQG